MTTWLMERAEVELFWTAVVIAEPTVQGSVSAVKRFVDMNPDARGTAPCVGEKENPNSA